MSRKLNLKGRNFGKLRVFSEVSNPKSGRVTWFCLCSCGGLAEVQSTSLVSGNTKSCGVCCNKAAHLTIFQYETSHGLSKHTLYGVLQGMINRCHNPRHKSYTDYGERGITVYPDWKNSPGNFISWALRNDYVEGLTIDRKENDLGYSPTNCRFITRQANNLNQRKNKRNKSGYRGVHFSTPHEQFIAQVNYKGEKHYLGLHPTAIEAAKERDQYIIDNNWPHKLNFNEEN